MRAEQITDPIAFHGEGPVWSEWWGGLRWLDMLAGDILTLTETGIERRHVGSIAACVRPRRGGGAVVGVERGFVLEDIDGDLEPLPELWSSTAIRMNEGGCDPDGRFYCGSMAYDQTPGAASLYRLDPDRSVETVLTGVTVSNGLDWSPDGSLAYYDDTETGAVAVFDYSREQGLTSRRQLAALPDDGRPDGLTVDADGCVWVAVVNGGAVLRFRPDGTLDGRVEVPGVTRVTACAFGGERLDRLFITTSREHLPPGEEPAAGALFAVDPGVTGLPVREFAG
ncbi:SMP-30/gluconolactonase/LRE family protein [Agrococcus sp. HG114]|uniref:SMP-30/gluconolactonase/LRE family protein n=1 Tax=Agrococcus sp. HG114 TaxID=2969757 RepID=UPI00215B5657|nr:SMP-30/gluconolactonase/LRE family protein [Agrococcus sp. HG114]MCR8670099.1 SMP-30/gluconolactonase/LRE family protein [Agrococcus sp. HG114]